MRGTGYEVESVKSRFGFSAGRGFPYVRRGDVLRADDLARSGHAHHHASLPRQVSENVTLRLFSLILGHATD
jgi:hypothetical protein